MRVWFIVLLVLALSGCSKGREKELAARTHGNPANGEKAIVKYGCHGCHDIPTVEGGRGAFVGPPLGGLVKRPFIAGRVPNEPQTVAKFIENPRSVDSETAMPQLGVQPQEARDITAFLYTLR